MTTPELTAAHVAELRRLFQAAWPEADDAFSDHDWDHAQGGIHVIAEEDGRILAHGSVVDRVLEAGGRPLRTGYVEAVATWPERQRQGHGSAVMQEIDAIIQAEHQLGALGTGEFAFYERLGWERWRGPTSVRSTNGAERTPDDDGYVMILRTPRTPDWLNADAPISCDWRPGDVW